MCCQPAAARVEESCVNNTATHTCDGIPTQLTETTVHRRDCAGTVDKRNLGPYCLKIIAYAQKNGPSAGQQVSSRAETTRHREENA